MRAKPATIGAALCTALALSACGAKQDVMTTSHKLAQPISVMLDWFPNADHVGLYEAIADGDFRAAGLDVHVEVPGDVASPIGLVAAGKVDVALSYEPEVFLARDQGAPVASIAAIVQRPLTSIIALGDEHITSVAQLRGKTVGDAGIPYQHAYLDTILRHAGVPVGSVREVDVGDDLVGSMLAGRVDATLGGYWNYEAIELRRDGKRPAVIPVNEAGVPDYDELVVVVNENTIATHDNELRRFVQALGRGYEAVRANPQAGVDALVRANPSLDRKLQLASVRATLPSFFPAPPNLPWGWQDQAQWNSFGHWMLAHDLIRHAAAVPDASVNELLAGQGP
jgi:putative hydroxymethylpyrimidine transport system substrate-binding protein